MTFQSVNEGAAGKVRIDEDFHRVTATLAGSAVTRTSPPAVTAVLIRRTPCEDFAGDFQGLRNQVGPNTGIVLMEVVYRVATGKAREQCADRYAGTGESDRAAVDAGRAVERLLNHGGLPDIVMLEVRHFLVSLQNTVLRQTVPERPWPESTSLEYSGGRATVALACDGAVMEPSPCRAFRTARPTGRRRAGLPRPRGAPR